MRLRKRDPDKRVPKLLRSALRGSRRSQLRLRALVLETLEETSNRRFHRTKPAQLFGAVYGQLIGPSSRIELGHKRHLILETARAWRILVIGQGQRNDPRHHSHWVPLIARLEKSANLDRLGEVVFDLETLDAELASIVDLRFFGRLGRLETAAVLGVSQHEVQLRWRIARAWIRRAITR